MARPVVVRACSLASLSVSCAKLAGLIARAVRKVKAARTSERFMLCDFICVFLNAVLTAVRDYRAIGVNAVFWRE
jgi:hypothetical protein